MKIRDLFQSYLLAARTPVRPNIPSLLPVLLPLGLDLLTRQALIVTIIPLAHRIRDLNLGLCPNRLVCFCLSGFGPGETFTTA
jgi:hypothetical protein